MVLLAYIKSALVMSFPARTINETPLEYLLAYFISQRNSINHSISKEDFSVTFSKFDNVVSLVKSVGKSAFKVKLDIKQAFRLCSDRPADWHL